MKNKLTLADLLKKKPAEAYDALLSYREVLEKQPWPPLPKVKDQDGFDTFRMDVRQAVAKSCDKFGLPDPFDVPNEHPRAIHAMEGMLRYEFNHGRSVDETAKLLMSGVAMMEDMHEAVLRRGS